VPAATTVGTYNIVPSAATGTGLGSYTIGYVNGTLTVNPATPNISWSNAAPITFFTPLTGMQLDAVASWTVGGSAVTVVGTLAYTPPVGALLLAGTRTLSAKFTPFDTTDYTTATATVQIDVLGPGVTVIGTWGRHPGFSSFDAFAGGPGSLAERSGGARRFDRPEQLGIKRLRCRRTEAS